MAEDDRERFENHHHLLASFFCSLMYYAHFLANSLIKKRHS